MTDIPIAKMAAAIRYLGDAADPRKLAKAKEAFKRAYKVDLTDACNEARRMLETMREAS